MRQLLLLLLFTTLVGTASAQTNFQIGAIGFDRTRFPGEARSLDFAVTRFSVPADMAPKDLILRAYYFSETGEALTSDDGSTPSFTNVREKDMVPAGPNAGRVSMPAKLEAGKKYEVRFGAPANTKWKRVIVVVGKKGDMVGKIYPKDDWTKYDFPDKASVRMAQ